MVPPSLPQPLNRLSGSSTACTRPPGGERAGRLPGPQGPDPLASGDRSPRRTQAFTLPATPASVGLARRNVRELLSAWDIDDDTCDDAVAVVSELVTNAVTHTGSARITCRLRAVPGRVHLEVEDESHGAGHPVPRQPHPDDQGGRGLLLVAALSGDWGVRDTADRGGRIVWAELLTPDTDSRPAPPHGTTRPIPHSAEGPLPYESTAHP